MKRAEIIEAICLILMGCIFSFFLGGATLGHIHANKVENQTEGCYEAAIIIEGEEIIRGQMDEYNITDNEITISFSNGEKWTTATQNFYILYHPN